MDFSSLSYQELRAELKSRGQIATGKKAELLVRLTEFESTKVEAAPAATDKKRKLATDTPVKDVEGETKKQDNATGNKRSKTTSKTDAKKSMADGVAKWFTAGNEVVTRLQGIFSEGLCKRSDLDDKVITFLSGLPKDSGMNSLEQFSISLRGNKSTITNMSAYLVGILRKQRPNMPNSPNGRSFQRGGPRRGGLFKTRICTSWKKDGNCSYGMHAILRMVKANSTRANSGDLPTLECAGLRISGWALAMDTVLGCR